MIRSFVLRRNKVAESLPISVPIGDSLMFQKLAPTVQANESKV